MLSGIPADLLRRRPDIRLAEFQAAAQGALIGVAKADLYPHFALGGSIGFATVSGSDLFDSASVAGFFTPFSFRWDIFNYGRIKNKVRVQDARFEQSLVIYQNKVLHAAKEVEDALVGFVRSQKQAHFLADGVTAAQRASELALLQYKEGLIDYTPVLNTQQVLVSQEDSLATSRGDIVRYLIAVYKALGGGMADPYRKRPYTGADRRNHAEPYRLGRTVAAGFFTRKKIEAPPTGQDVKLLHKPRW